MDAQKKTGILTFHRAINYGAALQAYALSQYLNEAGYPVEIVDFVPEGHLKTTMYYSKELSWKSLKRSVRALSHRQMLKKRDADFAEFTERFLPLSSSKNIRTSGLEEALKAYGTVICGSDQIWNPRLNDADTAFLLPYDAPYRRIAYGISTGDGQLTEYSQPELVRRSINRFDALSFRETSTITKLYRFMCPSSTPRIVADPVLLHSRSFYDRIAGERRNSEPYVFLYTVAGRPLTVRAAEALAEKTGLPYRILWAGLPNRLWDRTRGHVPEGDLGPTGFLAAVRDAEYIVTDSFHGAVFALLFGRRVIIIADEDEQGRAVYDDRLVQLLSQYHAEDLYVRSTDVLRILEHAPIDAEQTESIRSASAESSGAWLVQALEGVQAPAEPQTTHYMQGMICPTDLCTSCGACRNRCPTDAVTFRQDEDGRMIPVIGQDLCIGCMKCTEVCPVNHPVVKHPAGRIYAAQWRNREESIQSFTTGLASLISRTFVERGGRVYGAVIGKDLAVHHYGTDSLEGLYAMRGSKYVKSDTGMVFREIRNDLEEGRDVLFVGAPCQTAGLRSFIGEDDHLFCIDLVCHGAPPMACLKDYLESLHMEMDSYRFIRNAQDEYMTVMKDGKAVYSAPWWKDPFYSAYKDDFILAEDCYSCRYASVERTGDITLGDFWKINRTSVFDERRIALAMVNTMKGQQIWDSVSSELILEERTASEACAGNPNLMHPTAASGLRMPFMIDYRRTQSFVSAFERCGALDAYRRRIFAWGPVGRRIIKVTSMLKHSGEPQ